MNEVRDSLGYGRVYRQKEKRINHSECYRLSVSNPNDIREKLIPFFHKHHLKSQKKRNFELFCRIVEMTNCQQRVPIEKVEAIRQLKAEMNHGARPVRESRSPGGNTTYTKDCNPPVRSSKLVAAEAPPSAEPR